METPQKNDLHRERLFLFLSILVITIFLISTPNNLNDTFNFLTGASISDISTGGNNYLVGIIISIILLILITLFFHYFRKPKNIPITHFSEEEKSRIHSLKTKVPLTEKLDQINMEIQDLRKEEPPSPPKIPKKKSKIVNVKERELKRELERVDTELQGYTRPTIINAPEREEKFKSSLSYVEKKLSDLPNVNLKKVKVKTSLPEMRKVMEAAEKRRMKEELENLSDTLTKGKKNPLYFLQRFPWRKRKKKLIQNLREEFNKDLPKSELQDVEEKLARIKKELRD